MDSVEIATGVKSEYHLTDDGLEAVVTHRFSSLGAALAFKEMADKFLQTSFQLVRRSDEASAKED